MAKLPEDSAVEYLDFQLDKTYAAFFRAGEGIASSYVYTAMFLALTGALCLGNLETKDQIRLPLIGLELSRWHAAGMSLLLASVFSYSLVVMKATERLLSLKLDDLIARRFGCEGYHWYAFCPSVFSSSEQLGYVSLLGKIADFVPAVVMAAALFGVPYFAYVIVAQLGWSRIAVIMAGTALAILLLAVASFAATPLSSANRQKVLERIES